MPPEGSDSAARSDAQAWLAKAALDLRAARADLSVEPPLSGDAAFHCQQAVEKALKAVLALCDQPFRKTHDLRELGSVVAERFPDLKDLLRQAEVLTGYAWEFRYPGDVAEPQVEEVREALGLAERVVSKITEVVGLVG
jgi:HEPN domain-containing protein